MTEEQHRASEVFRHSEVLNYRTRFPIKAVGKFEFVIEIPLCGNEPLLADGGQVIDSDFAEFQKLSAAERRAAMLAALKAIAIIS